MRKSLEYVQGRRFLIEAVDYPAVQPCGAGHYYLPFGSVHWNAGTPNISTALKRDFADMTTVAPVVFKDPVTAAATLRPTAYRDVDLPDLGYHYPAIDYPARRWCSQFGADVQRPPRTDHSAQTQPEVQCAG